MQYPLIDFTLIEFRQYVFVLTIDKCYAPVSYYKRISTLFNNHGRQITFKTLQKQINCINSLFNYQNQNYTCNIKALCAQELNPGINNYEIICKSKVNEIFRELGFPWLRYKLDLLKLHPLCKKINCAK